MATKTRLPSRDIRYRSTDGTWAACTVARTCYTFCDKLMWSKYIGWIKWTSATHANYTYVQKRSSVIGIRVTTSLSRSGINTVPEGVVANAILGPSGSIPKSANNYTSRSDGTLNLKN
ncbi:uncharacterized protein LOC143148538 [Ptiloglossa arizonensis]|uniref:uncharacterized protein LOC143148538 n=1 Tax=Ptiloglossa arizonensis TaxID=3350558 RepID=UPI003FA1576C